MTHPIDPSHPPFRIGVLAEGEHFVDREVEVARVRAALLEPGARLVLYGDRRLGKSSVLQEAVRSVRAEGHGAALISFATASSEAEAAQRVLTALRSELGRSWSNLLEDVSRALDLSLELTADPVTGQPGVRLRVGRSRTADHPHVLGDVLNVVHQRLDKEDRTFGLCVDEFQRIHEWGGEDAEWALREAIQTHPRLSYVFAGSRRSLIEAMVGSKGRALWKQADVLPFGPIAPDILARWVWQRMKTGGADMERPAAERLISLTHPRTRDVVQLARAAFPGPGGSVNVPDVDASFERLVDEQAALYERIWRDLGSLDQKVLRVFAAAERSTDVTITAAETLEQFTLGPKSSVSNAVARLVSAELLAPRESGGYRFDDPFFRRWIQRYALVDLGLTAPPLS